MRQVDIKEYVAAEKEKLKNIKAADKIKLGIIDATRDQDDANAIYIARKLDDFKEVGWKASVYKVRRDETSCHDAIIRAMTHHCTAVIVQLPVRDGVKFDSMMIPRGLDCDGLRPDSLVNPATPQGIIDYLEACEFPFSGKTAVVLGRSDIVGKPMARMLLEKDMTVSICHSKSDPSIVSGYLQEADLVVSATGQPHLIVRNQCFGAVVIDVGITRQDGKLIGDFEEVPRFCSDTVWSTPVPGGVGLLTRLALLKNCAALVEGG
ncbi:MAG: bifunctional 5,10-methylenetetrahydrofolate dehydrogenase/5,10-methenyltetrahydrofolate cyclohydrolase [Acetobacter sp.]|nr:bifunctional 5,10-methylenetetrahydrofolate dehydrogenase/5,10-methenyltetrahydrofolate cyclohydrolase [Acetobacter sp.]